MSLSFIEEDDVSVGVVAKNLAKIKGSFASLVTKVTDNLKRKGINMADFRLYVITLFSRDIVSNANSVAEIIEAISRHRLWDYLSYSPIEEISRKFGGDDPELSMWISEYKSELAGFKAITKIADYIKVSNEDEDSMAEPKDRLKIARYNKQYYRRLSFKLKTPVTENSLDYIDKLWSSIAEHFFLPSLSVLLDTIKKGCVEVTWLVPTSSALKIQTNIHNSKEFLQANHMTRVMLDWDLLYDQDGGLEQVRYLIVTF